MQAFSTAEIRKECKGGHRTPTSNTVRIFNSKKFKFHHSQPTDQCTRCWETGPKKSVALEQFFRKIAQELLLQANIADRTNHYGHRMPIKSALHCSYLRRVFCIPSIAEETDIIVVSCNNTATCCNYKWIQNESAWIYKWWRERHAVNGLKQHPAEAPRSLALRPSRMWNGPMKQPVVGHCQVSGRQWAERWAFSSVSDRGQAVTCWNSWPSASSRWSDYVIYVWFYHMLSNFCGYDDMMQGWKSNLKIYNS